MQVQPIPPLIRKEEGAGGTEVAEVERAQIALILPSPPPPVEVDGKRRMDFLAKSKSQSLVGKRATWVTSLMPSDSGLGASLTTGITMRTLI